MKIDHTEFILRQEKAETAGQAGGEKTCRKIFFSFVFFFLYFAGCVALAVMLEVSKFTMLVAGVVFVLAALFAFLVQRFLQGYSSREKEWHLLREVLEGSRGARLITDGLEQSVFFNRKFEALCGEQAKEGLEALSDLFCNNEESRNAFHLLKEQAGRGLSDSAELYTGSGGKGRWFMVTARPVTGFTGYIHWRINEITDQRDHDFAIREEREKLIDFTDNAPVGFFSVDEKGHFVFVNATLARWLGNDIQQLLSDGRLHTYLAQPPLDGAPYDIVEKGGARQVAEIMMKGPGGKTFLASVNQAVVREEGGRVRTRGVVHDLTSEREMRRALQASEDRFQRFFEEAPLGIALIDADGMVQDCNLALANVLGRPVKALESVAFKDLISVEDQDVVLGALRKIGQGEKMLAPMEITLSGERNVSVQMHAKKFKGSDSTVLHFIDLTDQKALEAQFIQSQKMQAVGQLAGGVAHDFNNLLTAIIGFCDLLLLRHKPGDPSFGDIMQVKQNSNRAANLVRQLLAFSRQQTLRPQVHDVSDILIEVSHLIRRLIGANIELDLVHGQDLGLIKVDLGQMEQVLVNLAVNARDAMGEGGKLTISSSNFETARVMKRGDDQMPPGQWVRIEVRDTGTGISKENISRIFEPFFTTKEVGEGTGLGLATVYGIVRQTGGYLHVESKVGEGTVFSLYFPRLSKKEEEEAHSVVKTEEESEGDLTGSARILLVEDEDAVRMFSTRALENKGYKILSAEHGRAALDLMEQQENKTVDLLITDVMMPDMDGPTLAGHMRETSPDLKIIFISGYTEDRLKDHMGKNIYFLPKPFTLKQLAGKVKEALGE